MFPIIFTLFLSTGLLAAECLRPVDPLRVVVFVDTRNSTQEVASAKRAACERGETFKHIGKNINYNNFSKEMTTLAHQGKAVTSLVVSGHDGGGSIHGDNGNELDKDDVIKAMKLAYQKKPALLNKFQSVHMWGCWTNGPGEVASWRKELPSLKLISGFIDMAPINTAKASSTILEDILKKERELLNKKDKKDLHDSLKLIENINQTFAAVYIEACNENLYYYRKDRLEDDDIENTSDPRFTPGAHYVNFDNTFNCQKKPADYLEKREKIKRYYLGYDPIPQDTAGGELRGLYKFARNNSQCLSRDPVFNGDRLLMMTFFENVKQNFSRTFKTEINEADAAYREIIASMKNPGFDRWDLPVLKDLKKTMLDHQSDYFKATNATITNKNRLQIRKMLMHLDTVLKHNALVIPSVERKFRKLKVLREKMEIYLFQLNPNCMDFIEWHDAAPGYAPEAQCPRPRN